MVAPLRYFSQREYTRALSQAGAQSWTQGDCQSLLMSLGADYEQAKNGAYLFLHHRNHLVRQRQGTQREYDAVLDRFGARTHSAMECVRHLEARGYTAGQAKSAVHVYRRRRGLIGH